MRKVKSKIKGYKSGSGVDGGNSYDVAYRLCHTLRLYLKRFLCYKNLVTDEDIIIYPSAWYAGFFEITLRDKNHVSGNQCVDFDELMGVVRKFVPRGWVCFDEEFFDGDEGVVCTPVVLKFRFEGVD